MTMQSFFSKTSNLIGIGVGVVVFVVLISLYGTHQSVISQGNRLESGLTSNYADGANYLSNCVIKTKQSANVANAQTEALDKVLRDAVAGRYGTGNNLDKAKLFSAIVEAYPDTSGLSKTFNDVLATINGCQDDFRNKQSDIQDNVRQFNSWRNGSWRVRTFGGGGFPNDNLTIDVGDVHLSGAAAFTQMRKPIVESEVVNSYKTGTTDTKNPFDTNNN